EKLKKKATEAVQFLSYDIWRLNPENFSNKKNIFHNILKTIMLTVRNVQEQDLGASSRSLTYRTILSLVPLLAVLFAIGRGFGFENIIESEFFRFFGGQNDTAKMVVEFINNSLMHAQGGIFAGVGITLLLYTVFVLFSDIENNFNRIWQVQNGRNVQRRVTDYFALVLLMPVFMLLNSGLNIMISSSTAYFDTFSYILNPLVTQFLNILPFIIIILVLTLTYRFMPNTKVKFGNAFIGGVVAGTAFQVFQMLYLSGQLWITKYNAIYGTFAAIPLLLLWLQLSWFIVLIGAELTYSAQNVRKFSFDKETKNISRRYRDFFTIMIASVIVKRFAEKKSPLTPDQLSVNCKIPLRLTNDIINLLQDLKIISPTPSPEDEGVMAYQPAIDIHLITSNFLLKKIDTKGSEDFMIDVNGEFASHWETLIHSRMCMYESDEDVLLKDL
ncbi:MAG TPA: YihY/virulence factor BrkB family protein, partial [Porphyromonadaceae bacterium]|nr:YihY/virulence factor BrkB family protein [Porphyromonadaceae bacterium]